MRIKFFVTSIIFFIGISFTSLAQDSKDSTDTSVDNQSDLSDEDYRQYIIFINSLRENPSLSLRPFLSGITQITKLSRVQRYALAQVPELLLTLMKDRGIEDETRKKILRELLELDYRDTRRDAEIFVEVMNRRHFIDIAEFMLQQNGTLANIYMGQSRKHILYIHAFAEHLERVELLLKYGANRLLPVHYQNEDKTSILVAAFNLWAQYPYNKYTEILKRLDPEGVALFCRALTDNRSDAQSFFPMGIDPDSMTYVNGTTVLFEAVHKNNKKIVELLLSQGANINQRDPNGNAVLAYAYDQTMLAFLLQEGADIHAKNNKGETALSLAIEGIKAEGAEADLWTQAAIFLINHEKQSKEQCEEVFKKFFIEEVHHEFSTNILRALLDKGVSPDIESDKGHRALHNAIRRQDLQQINMLLDRGADINGEENTTDRRRPLDYALRSSMSIIVTLFKRGVQFITPIDSKERFYLEPLSWVMIFGEDPMTLDLFAILLERDIDIVAKETSKLAMADWQKRNRSRFYSLYIERLKARAADREAQAAALRAQQAETARRVRALRWAAFCRLFTFGREYTALLPHGGAIMYVGPTNMENLSDHSEGEVEASIEVLNTTSESVLSHRNPTRTDSES